MAKRSKKEKSKRRVKKFFKKRKSYKKKKKSLKKDFLRPSILTTNFQKIRKEFISLTLKKKLKYVEILLDLDLLLLF